MTKLDEGFDALGREPTPDLWPDIGEREPRSEATVDEVSVGRRAAIVTLALLIALAGLGLAWRAFLDTKGTVPAGPRDAGLVAFVASEPQPQSATTVSDLTAPPPPADIYVAAPDGSEPRALTTDGDPKGSVEWSPDGTTLAYTRYPIAGSAEQLWLIASDGSDQRILCTGCSGTFFIPGGLCFEPCYTGPVPTGDQLAWSPDGRFIAAPASPEGGLALIDASSGAVDVASDRGRVAGVAWSPDGSQLAAVVEGDGLEVLDVDAGSTRLLLRSELLRGAVAWSPNGEQIAVSRGVKVADGYHAEVLSIDVSTGASSELVGRSMLFDVYDLAWSPDGSRLAMLHHPVHPPTSGVLTVAPDGSDVHLVAICDGESEHPGVCPGNGGSLAWSPDGEVLALASHTGGSASLLIVQEHATPIVISGELVVGCCLAWQATPPSGSASSIPPEPTGSEPPAQTTIDVGDPVPVGVPYQTSAIVASPDAVWVSYYDDTGGKLARLDPDTLATVATIDGVPSGGWSTGGGGLAYDGQSVWVAGNGELVAIDASTDRVVRRIQLAGDRAADVAAGALGWWVLETATQPDRMIIESVDPTRGSATVTTTLPYAYARRILAVGGYLAVVSLEQSDPAGGVGDPRLTLLDWEAGGSAIGSQEGQPFTSAQLVSDGSNGWALDGSNLVELDGVNLLHPIRTIRLPIARPDRIAVGGGGIWVVSHAGELLRVDPSTGRVDDRTSLPEGAGWSDAAATNEALYLMSADGTVTRISIGP